MEAAAHGIAEDSPVRALRWLDAIAAHILKLADFPRRCPVAAESREFSATIRQTAFGHGRGGHRTFFALEGECVAILHGRHAMRATLTAAEIERPRWQA